MISLDQNFLSSPEDMFVDFRGRGMEGGGTEGEREKKKTLNNCLLNVP